MNESNSPEIKQPSSEPNDGRITPQPEQSSPTGLPEIRLAYLASSQNFLILGVLNQLVVLVVSGVLSALDIAVRFELLVFFGVMLFIIGCVAVVNVVYALDGSSGMPLVWCVAMLIPVVALIALLILNQRATSRLKQAGLKVGLLGAKGIKLNAIRNAGAYLLVWGLFVGAYQAEKAFRSQGDFERSGPTAPADAEESRPYFSPRR